MIHHVFYYVKDNFTTHKTQDVYGIQSKKYQDMMESLDRAYDEAIGANQIVMIDQEIPAKYLENSLLDVLVEEGAL
jgi:hypothetical protein